MGEDQIINFEINSSSFFSPSFSFTPFRKRAKPTLKISFGNLCATFATSASLR